jgi:hypothetical protein
MNSWYVWISLVVACTPNAMAEGSRPDLRGSWRGYAQFRASEHDQAPLPHSPVLLTLEIGADGKVTGASPVNGCTVAGKAAPGTSSSALSLDVTFGSCQYGGFNRRFSGSLGIYSEGHAQLNLRSSSVAPSAHYDVRARLRR